MQRIITWGHKIHLWHWLVQVFVAFDQLLNVLLGPCSKHTWADETLSSRCGRLGHRYPYKFWKVVIDLLFWWQGPDHCVNAYHKEKARYQMPPDMRSMGSNVLDQGHRTRADDA